MVATRRSRTDNARLQQAAVAAINRGGERALKAMLGIAAGKPSRSPAARKLPTTACAAQEREIQRLRAVVAALKAGRALTAQRAARQPANFRQVNLFAKTNGLWGGQPYAPADVAWKQAQVTDAGNRELARQRQKRQFDRAVRALGRSYPRSDL